MELFDMQFSIVYTDNMYDLISIGNISVDLFFKGDSLTYKDARFQLAVGGKYFADEFHTSIGGGGANVAIGAAKAGLKTAVLGVVGDNPFKKMIAHVLEVYKVSGKLCMVEKDYSNVSCILLNKNGERSIVHYTTPHQHILSKDVSINRLIDTKIVYLGNLPDVPLSERETVLGLCKKNNILTVLNLGVKDCRRPKKQIEELLKKVDILILNGHEFAELVKAQYKDLKFSEDVVKWYIPNLSNTMIIITEGKNGSYGYSKNKVFHQKAVEVDKVIDTTGAGDGYTAGFIAEYHKSKNIEKAMEKGSQYASRILAKIGAN